MTEKEVRERFEETFSRDFKLWPEVWLRHCRGQRLRIDYVGQCHRFDFKGFVGFEIKRPDYGDEHWRKFVRSLVQGMDYAECVIESDLEGAPEIFGRKLRYVFIYPSTYDLYSYGLNGDCPVHNDWAMGAVRVAACKGVGTIQPAGGEWHSNVFLLGSERIYELGRGPTNQRHEVSERVGSAV